MSISGRSGGVVSNEERGRKVDPTANRIIRTEGIHEHWDRGMDVSDLREMSREAPILLLRGRMG